jgi:hypothetical protein
LWETSVWSRERRVIAKAEWTQREAHPALHRDSFMTTECKASYLYEKVYCARGDMENRIKERQLDLYTDRSANLADNAGHLPDGTSGRIHARTPQLGCQQMPPAEDIERQIAVTVIVAVDIGSSVASRSRMISFGARLCDS